MKRNKNCLEYARWLGLYYLGIRAHTRGEMRQKLKRKEIDDNFCDEALDYLEECGYINDFEYAVSFIKNAASNQKYGKMRIMQKLREKKINSDVIERAFDEADADFGDSLMRALEVKARSLDLSNRKDREKLIAHLVRKGFKIGEIIQKLEEYSNG